MEKKLKILSLLTLSLFVISIALFTLDTHRGSSSLEGTPLLPGLDINGISRFEIQGPNQEKLKFGAQEGYFLLESFNNYPAITKKVNDLFYALSVLEIKEVVNAKETDYARFKLSDNDYQLRLDFFNQEGKNHLTIFLGENYKTSGTYVRLGGKNNIFLTNSLLAVSRSLDEYLNRSMFESIDKAKIDTVELDNSVMLTKGETEEKWSAKGPGPEVAKLSSEKITSWLNDLLLVRFTDVTLARSVDLRAGQIVRNVRFKLKNDLIFWIKVYKMENEFLVNMLAEVIGNRQNVEINPQEADEAKMKEVEGLINAQTTAQSFNSLHQAWAYKIKEDDLKKFNLPKD